MANKYSISAQETAERIASFFVSIGCNKVYDINLARHLAIVESYREFKERRDDKSKFPIISSICPGWICYAEKTNGDLLIPHLSKVRSPQQIMGALIKRLYSSKDGRKRSDIYHVTLMPCFDKKLEASRQDFKDKNDGSQDVDCVLTPLEFEEILTDEGVTLFDFDPRKLDILVESDLCFDQPLTSHFGSASGGYAENILLAEASETLNDKHEELQNKLEYSTLKNGDFIEVSMKNVDNGTTKLTRRFAIVNGFRNIQTIVQRLKRNALKYDYIEIMACPSGCINGGAQCKPGPGADQASTVELARQVYNEVPKVQNSNVKSEEFNDKLYSSLSLKEGLDINELLYTNFHPVPKMQNLIGSW